MKRLRGRSNSAEWSSKKGTLDVPFLHDAASTGQPIGAIHGRRGRIKPQSGEGDCVI